MSSALTKTSMTLDAFTIRTMEVKDFQRFEACGLKLNPIPNE